MLPGDERPSSAAAARPSGTARRSHSSPELIESLKDFGRLMIINDLQLDADNLDLKTDLMLDFTVAVSSRCCGGGRS